MNIPQFYFNDLTPIFSTVEDIITDWFAVSTDQGCLQLPVLMVRLQTAFDWNEKETNAKEPVIRDYLEKHPLWYVRRGAYGGIGKRTDKDKKVAAQTVKEAAREERRNQLMEELNKKLVDTATLKAEEDQETVLDRAVEQQERAIERMVEVLSTDTNAAE